MQYRLSCFSFLTLTLLLSADFCFAQGEMAVETISGEKLSGNLQRIDAGGTLIGGGFEGVNIEQILSISTGRKSNPPATGLVKLRQRLR